MSFLFGGGDDSPAQSTLPSQATSQEISKQAQLEQRRAAILAGGLTDITGGTGIILGSDIKHATLIGE